MPFCSSVDTLNWVSSKSLYMMTSSNRNIIRITGPLWPLLLTRINYNPSMDKWLHQLWSVAWNYLSILEFQWCSRWSLGMDKTPHTLMGCDDLSIMGLKIIHVSKRGLMLRLASVAIQFSDGCNYSSFPNLIQGLIKPRLGLDMD